MEYVMKMTEQTSHSVCDDTKWHFKTSFFLSSRRFRFFDVSLATLQCRTVAPMLNYHVFIAYIVLRLFAAINVESIVVSKVVIDFFASVRHVRAKYRRLNRCRRTSQSAHTQRKKLFKYFGASNVKVFPLFFPIHTKVNINFGWLLFGAQQRGAGEAASLMLKNRYSVR